MWRRKHCRMGLWLTGILFVGAVLTLPGGCRRRDRCPAMDSAPKDPRKVRVTKPRQHLFPKKMRRQ